MTTTTTTEHAPIRCGWCSTDPLYQHYHDTEWGVPVRDAQRLFEKICLEGQQAGLSWITVLKKRARYRQQFFDFDPTQVALLSDADLADRCLDAGLIRHIGKLTAIRDNARAWLALSDTLIEQGGDLVTWFWSFVGGQTQLNHLAHYTDGVSQTEASMAMSKALKKAGFRFVGPTTCYAFMQSMGMINDHSMDCFRYAELAQTQAQRP